MKISTPFFLLFFTITMSCNFRNPGKDKAQFRDSIMQRYFLVIDSLGYDYSYDDNLNLLKAYHQNDTNYLKSAYADISLRLEYKRSMPDSFICKLPDFDTSNVEEIYQFSYGRALCNEEVIITMKKSTDSAMSLNLFLIEVDWATHVCKVILDSTKKINPKEWSRFRVGLYEADYWGLMEDNGERGLDGSSLTVKGYEKAHFEGQKSKRKEVYRWAGERTSIGRLFENVIGLSGMKVRCFPE